MFLAATLAKWIGGRDFKELSEDLITRGKNYKFMQQHCHYNIRKFSLTNSIFPKMNSLSDHFVSAKTINTSERSLDKFLSDFYTL